MSRLPELPLFAALLGLLLTGCIPLPPDASSIRSTSLISPGIESHELTPPQRLLMKGGEVVQVSSPISPRTLIFVAVDDLSQPLLKEQLQRLYLTTTPPRLDEMAWWRLFPELRTIYDRVIRIDHSHFNAEGLIQALDAAEKRGVDYDLILLTHGLPNHLKASKGQGFVTWEDLAKLKGKLQHLDLVYMQSCFGSSLSKDWLEAGARSVVAYPGFNSNPFYLEFFLPKFRESHLDALAAVPAVNSSFESRLSQSHTHKWILKHILHQDVRQFMQESPLPELRAR